MARNVRVRSAWEQPMALRDAVNELFEQSFVRQPTENGRRSSEAFVPPADAWEDADKVVVEMAVPGVEMDDVEVTVQPDALIVSGRVARREAERRWVLSERARGAFRREFALNIPVDADKVEATVSNGVLTLRLPKHEQVKPRKIEVKAG